MSEFPLMARVKIRYDVPELVDPCAHLRQLLTERTPSLAVQGRVGIAVGSRGIFGLQNLVAETVAYLRGRGAEPVILTAMGSHGGATAQGQREVLASYGVTEERVGAKIIADMQTVELGCTEKGHSVYFDARALELDGIVLLNRIKPHTDFHQRIESGLLKQMVIGLGNHVGAQYVHSYGLQGLKTMIPGLARVILDKAPIIFGVGIIENARDTTAELHVLTPSEMEAQEARLVPRAAQLMPRLVWDDLDVLVVECMGKNYSGVGIDSNITGRRFIRQDPEGDQDRARRIACLDLSDESHGNALGMGLADVISRRLYDKIDFSITYANVVTSGFLERGFVPVVLESDRECIRTAIGSCGRRVAPDRARLVQIANTLELSEMFVARHLLSELPAGLDWQLEDEFAYRFSERGDLLNWVKMQPNG